MMIVMNSQIQVCDCTIRRIAIMNRILKPLMIHMPSTVLNGFVLEFKSLARAVNKLVVFNQLKLTSFTRKHILLLLISKRIFGLFI